MNIKYCFLILLPIISVNVFAGITKWVDSNGEVHYSDGPAPANAKTTIVPISSQPAPIVVPSNKELNLTPESPNQLATPENVPIDRTKERVPYLKPVGQDAFKAYLQSPSPKSFLIMPDGSYSICSGNGCRGDSLKSCQKINPSCKLYALDNDVVFKKINSQMTSLGQ